MGVVGQLFSAVGYRLSKGHTAALNLGAGVSWISRKKFETGGCLFSLTGRRVRWVRWS